MKTEKILFSFIAVFIGVVVAGAGFYLYQTTKTISPSKLKTIAINSPTSPTPSPLPSIYLAIDQPRDEEVLDKKTLTISGKTVPDAVLIISTKTTDDIITPASNGNFTTTETIGDGINQIQITAIAPNGEEVTAEKTVTFSTETF